jgi:23S rRNA (adenine2503-C2)-methyltransferase
MTANLLEFDLDGLAVFCEGWAKNVSGPPSCSAGFTSAALQDFDQMSDLGQVAAPKAPGSRAHFSLACHQPTHLADGTIKWLFDVGDGNAIESVFIPEDDRGTLCISSQAGCAVGCRFCSTGHQGFSRNLTTGEILSQLWFAEHALRKHLNTTDRVISNVVMMGMGEPLQNYSALVPALRAMLDDHGYGLSRRRVTVSTSGVVPMMERLGPIVPWLWRCLCMRPTMRCATTWCRSTANTRCMNSCKRASLTWPMHPRDFITFEYCMLDGVNDQPEHASQAADRFGQKHGAGKACVASST